MFQALLQRICLQASDALLSQAGILTGLRPITKRLFSFRLNMFFFEDKGRNFLNIEKHG